MKIAMVEGYGRVRRRGVRKARKSAGRRLARAAKACKGLTKGKFKKCMKRKLRSKSRR